MEICTNCLNTRVEFGVYENLPCSVCGGRQREEVAVEDWQAVSTWPDFTIEADCNSGRYRRVYRDGRIEIEG
ncbi:hypothetical protein [Aeromonas salmonicida]|uniref:hypothetical protein n=1 Tax=Aeromonas salmonicida TaxID=645 RepID=UPI001F3D97B3|nr:hypothetical protein [Aeromonas salmonicida]MCE9935653.1 hypothetical protein [Aeromonas salmonicida]